MKPLYHIISFRGVGWRPSPFSWWTSRSPTPSPKPEASHYIEAPFDCNHGFTTWKAGLPASTSGGLGGLSFCAFPGGTFRSNRISVFRCFVFFVGSRWGEQVWKEIGKVVVLFWWFLFACLFLMFMSHIVEILDYGSRLDLFLCVVFQPSFLESTIWNHSHASQEQILKNVWRIEGFENLLKIYTLAWQGLLLI